MKMKKIICLVLIIMMTFVLCSCASGGSLPKGHAKRIEIDYGSGISHEDVDFEYVTETTVKIIGKGEVDYYYPVNRIKSITVEK